MDNALLVIGGDKRHYMAAGIIKTAGYDIYMYGFERLPCSGFNVTGKTCLPYADYVLMPAPYKDDEGYIKMPFSDVRITLSEICPHIGAGTCIVFGGEDEESKKLFDTCGLYSFDLLKDEAYAVRNAYITAQAAAMIALKTIEKALSDCSVLICGYGRIGKSLARILKVYNCKITVSARKEKDLEWIKSEGFEAVNTCGISGIIGEKDIIFNTVPFRIIGEKELACVKRGACIIELASKPHGIDMDEAKRRGIEVLLELGLPGRCFPESAAGAVADAFLNIAAKRMVACQ